MTSLIRSLTTAAYTDMNMPNPDEVFGELLVKVFTFGPRIAGKGSS